MPRSLRILVLEDRPSDATLMLHELLHSGFNPQWRRVETESDFLASLDSEIEVILADYSLPQFNARRALALMKQRGLDIPFIIVSANIGEELAVECMKEGADDYLLKDRLTRLGQAVTQALEKKRLREEKRQAEAALQESNERYALASQGANDGLWDWDLTTQQLYFSPRWKAMLGYQDHEIPNNPDAWFDRVHPDELQKVKEALDAHLAGATQHFMQECRLRHRDGSYRWMLVRGSAVRKETGEAKRIAGSFTDITTLKWTEERLLHHAYHDTLTGLPNRTLFMDHLALALLHSKRRDGYMFAVLLMDLDEFKIVNDSLGPSAGDELLIQVSKRLARCLRPGDTVARLGGDEFAILIDDTKGLTNATRITDRIFRELKAPFYLKDREIFTTASMGIALSSTGYESPQEILRDADTAMNRAKKLGKARFSVFDMAMHTKAIARLQLETDLRKAVEQQEFVLHYQPIVTLESGEITGFEALQRWQLPDGSLVPPAEYLPVAEETGLLFPIGQWVLHEACRQVKMWKGKGVALPNLYINVNLSGKQFLQLDLTNQIHRVLVETGLEPNCLGLEITETVIMENAETAKEMLKQLKAYNIQTCIDDFGTGYSSLSYLQQFPIDILKIDRSFISGLGQKQEAEEIVRAILTLAHSLHMKVVAEGVETEAQWALLKALGCEYAQGFLFSKPVPSESAEALLTQHPLWQPTSRPLD